MKLNILEGEDRFIVSQGRIDSPLNLRPMEFGNIIPVELRMFRKTPRGLVAVDLSTYDVSLLVGPPNVRPTLGFWTLTTTEGTSAPMASRASAQDAATALRDAFGECIVTGGEGSYIVTIIAAGIWELPTASFQGNTLSNVLIFEITPGTATTSAQYRIEVLEIAPARIVPADWSQGDTTATGTATLVTGRLWQLELSEKIDSGFFSLTVDGQTTNLISYLANSFAIETALSAIGKPAQVLDNGAGGFYLLFAEDVSAVSVGGNLVVFPYLEGALDLTSSGVRELLDGVKFAAVKLSVVLVKDGETTTTASTDAMLQMPVNQPATITIDAPQMAGLTFSISNDQSAMHVYQSGTLAYDIPLNNPV